MSVSGAPVDSSTINILTTTSSKQTADVDYIVWKTYGQEIEQKSHLVEEIYDLKQQLTIHAKRSAKYQSKYRKEKRARMGIELLFKDL
jgi:hypothetical protein